MSEVFHAEWLDRSLTLLRGLEEDDGFTKVRGEPEEVGRFRAKRTDVSDAEQVRAAQQGAAIDVRFLARSTPITRGILLTDQIDCDGTIYEVRGTKEASRFGRRVAIEITAAAKR